MNEMTPPLKAKKPLDPLPAKKQAVAARDYAEFLPAALEISATPPPKVVPALIATMTAAILAGLVWSACSWLDVYTNASGRVRSTVPAAVVQPLETGQVKSIHVESGQHVQAGDVLLRLDDVAINSALHSALAGRASWLGEVERRTTAFRSVSAGRTDVPDIAFDASIPEQVKRRESEALASEIQSLAASLSAKQAEQREAEARKKRFKTVAEVKTNLMSILTERVGMMGNLQNTGAGSRGEFLAMKDQQVRVEADLADTSAQIAEIDASIRNAREQQTQAISGFLAEQARGIQAAERQVEQLDQEIVKQRDRQNHLSLKAPISGTVQQLAVNSSGQVVNPGQPLLVIVPDDADLIVEALVPSQEIGFVKVGDDVVVKADAFPFTRYGTFDGIVKTISDDAVTIRDAQGLQDATLTATGQAAQAPNGTPTVNGLFYVARIELKQTDLTSSGHRLKLEPGMTVRAEIKTESRRVIDYILSPVSQILNESGHEK